ncbi:FHA domain-containing protein [Oculatella sp. FACHB-28]|uniref:FHA domain-containing protein n=1 Tax=Cyanophyceae TaxID=3028117 RepID=UPI001681F9EE|nr:MULTISPECIES: FHA domain-containing protein [Cyanophyceae]MBD2000709.1 FHA domain-containing protein [Leptolyngbya sp. FACHB-541]MBD2056799.1 FHA domain-containing protein [Oculatella sp. FACHB-28]MBD2068366.1 FHA domain-containing protein [Leptolyngbya sp. FACHB-671]
MSPLQSSVVSNPCPLLFLEQNPSLSDSLCADCDFNIDQVATLIRPVLQAQQRCQLSSCYIQAVAIGRTSFLITNLMQSEISHNTAIASSWLIGRSLTCAITVQDPSASRCHAVISHHRNEGFSITDIGSSNGTLVNRRRIPVMERRSLQDGDLIQIGSLKIEFFVTTRSQPAVNAGEATYY